MVEYMEREFGERALNGDKSQAAILQAKIAELERMLDTQRAAENSTADSKPRSDMGSENETDSDVSYKFWFTLRYLFECIYELILYMY